MTFVERWMLPDGIEEILPPEAFQIEQLRRELLDLFGLWGYELVSPPKAEFTDSLVVGLGRDVDLLTFKVTDQLTGRTMGIPADFTPQIARIDAHSLKRSGVNRLCYTGHVLRTRMENALDTRSPMQLGIEMFGESELLGEAEVISLLLESLRHAQVEQVCLDLGHVAIFGALSEAAQLTKQQESDYFNLLQAKALTEIENWIEQNLQDPQQARWFHLLPRLTGNIKSLDGVRDLLEQENVPVVVIESLKELQTLAETLEQRYPEVQLYFDLSELTGYQYLTGMVFSAFIPNQGSAIARGGRYDHIGKVFGRSRSAVGFTADLVSIYRQGQVNHNLAPGIFVPESQNPAQWQAIQALRAQGERVICAGSGQTDPLSYQVCDRQLLEVDGEFKVEIL